MIITSFLRDPIKLPARTSGCAVYKRLTHVYTLLLLGELGRVIFQQEGVA